MAISLDTSALFHLHLALCRLTGIFLLSPVLGFSSLPPTVRIMLVLVLALCVAAPVQAAGLESLSFGRLVLDTAVSLIQGAILGGALRAAFAAFSLGGQLVDFQIGFSSAAIFDPATRIQNSLVSTLFEMTALVGFFVMDLHHDLLHALGTFVRETRDIATGSGALGAALVGQLGLVFVYGFALVAPVVLGLLLLDLAIAIASRSMPQINIYFVSLPLKVLVGLLLLTTSVQYLAPLAGRIFGQAIASVVPTSA